MCWLQHRKRIAFESGSSKSIFSVARGTAIQRSTFNSASPSSRIRRSPRRRSGPWAPFPARRSLNRRSTITSTVESSAKVWLSDRHASCPVLGTTISIERSPFCMAWLSLGEHKAYSEEAQKPARTLSSFREEIRGLAEPVVRARPGPESSARPGAIDAPDRLAKRRANRVAVSTRLTEQHDETDRRADDESRPAHAGELRHRKGSASTLRTAKLELAPERRRQRGQRLGLNLVRKIGGDCEAIWRDDEPANDVLELQQLCEQATKVTPERGTRDRGGAHASSERQLPHTRSRWATAVSAFT